MAVTAALFEEKGERGAKEIFMTQCSICHGEGRAGAAPDIPARVGMGDRRSPSDIATTIRGGKGRMPGFPNLDEDQLNGLVEFLLTGESKDLGSYGASLPLMN